MDTIRCFFFLIIDLLDSAGLKPLVAATESNYRKTCKKLILEGMTDDRPSIDTYHMADVCYRWRFIVFFFLSGEGDWDIDIPLLTD